MISEYEMIERRRSYLVAYSLAVLAPAISLLLRWPLWPVIEDALPHMTFLPAVAVAAYYGGLRPGLLATFLSALAADSFLVAKQTSTPISFSQVAIGFCLFTLTGVIISALSESLHAARRRIVADERKRAEEARREAENRFRQMAENIHEIFWVMDIKEERFLYISPGYEAVWGQTCLSLYEHPRSWIESVHPEDRPDVFENLEQCRKGVFTDLEFRILRPDRSVRWIRNRAFPNKDQEGDNSRIAGLLEDISERKRAEEALRESEQRFRTFVDHATDALFLFDDGFVVLDVNCQACQSLGYSRDELLGMTPIDFDPDVTSVLLEELRHKLDDGQLVAFESRHRRQDGTVFPVEVRGKAFWEGGRRFFVSLARDNTERKRVEEALRESEQRWRSLTEALPQLVWAATADGSCDYFSTQWTQHTGVPEGELLGWRWLAVLHPDDRGPTRQFWTAAVEGRGPYDVEYRVRRHDGVYRWFKTRGVPIRDSEGIIFKWFGTCTDITDLRQTEEALRESEARFRGTFENAAVGIAHTHPNGRLLRVNEKFCAIVGYPREELLQKTFQDITHPDDLGVSVGSLMALLRGDLTALEHEKRYLRKDGSPVWVELFTSLQRDAAGQPAYAIAVIQDISERKRLDAELRRAKEAAEAANRAKDEFLANVSHEIRTPMNAIIGMTELALDTPLTDDQRQCLRTVKSAADNLLGIINDLLDFAKIEAGKIELDPAGFSLRAALGDTLRALAVRAHRKRLELIYHVQPDVPDALVGDAGRLRQVLLNLVGNAIKFTEEGEVIVRVDVVGDSPPEGEVGLRFAVRDTGIGIPPDRQERIFRAFEQEDTSTTRRYGGTGLGLTIAARLVALMGGTITVESEPGRGSTFAFTARFGRQPHPQEPVNIRLPVLLHNLPVLIVDDNATNRYILEEWLRGWQMKPEAVADGLAALDALWDAVTGGRPYPLVLLDARMPDTDGLTLAAKIRRRAELSATRIVLLTSGDRPGDLARARELRIDAHLLKPVQQEELIETIFRTMSRADGEGWGAVRPAPAPVPVPISTAALRILVAEDNEFNALLLEQLLVRRGHRVRLANNGREALSLVEEGGFDLLLLDVHMPELDGFQVIQAIRERERVGVGHLPVIALTARSRKEDREQCLAAGMDDFLAKPVGAADLWAAINRVATACSDRSSGEGGGMNKGEENVGDPVQSSRSSPFDPSVLLTACDGDATLLGKMCQAFRVHLPDHLTAIRNALQDRDAPRLREAAHKLCGMVATVSTAAATGASALEDLAAGGRFDESAPLVDQLETMGRELIRQVDGLSVETLRYQAGAAVAPARPPRQGDGPARNTPPVRE